MADVEERRDRAMCRKILRALAREIVPVEESEFATGFNRGLHAAVRAVQSVLLAKGIERATQKPKKGK